MWLWIFIRPSLETVTSFPTLKFGYVYHSHINVFLCSVGTIARPNFINLGYDFLLYTPTFHIHFYMLSICNQICMPTNIYNHILRPLIIDSFCKTSTESKANNTQILIYKSSTNINLIWAIRNKIINIFRFDQMTPAQGPQMYVCNCVCLCVCVCVHMCVCVCVCMRITKKCSLSDQSTWTIVKPET